MNCFFSIIVPTYNRASLLPHTIASILKQRYENWELIIVDDGSTDNTKELIASYQDNRILYIYQANAERCAARNNGIKHATGQYICFLDSDDTLTESYLADLYELINAQTRKDLFIITSMKIAEGNSAHISTHNMEEINKNPYDYFFRKSIPPSSICLSAHLLQHHAFDTRIVVSEDTKMWVEILQEKPCIVLNTKVGVNFLFHTDNTINIQKRNVYKERQNTLRLILQEDVTHNISHRTATQTVNDCYMGIYRHYMANKKYAKAINSQLVSLWTMPCYKTKSKLYNILFTLKTMLSL